MADGTGLLGFTARDGSVIRGSLITVEGGGPDTPVLLQIHGSLGHSLAHGTPRLLPRATRRARDPLPVDQHAAGVDGADDDRRVFDDTRWDLEAAVAVLAREGFRNVFVLGDGLGAAMVVHWAAAGVPPRGPGAATGCRRGDSVSRSPALPKPRGEPEARAGYRTGGDREGREGSRLDGRPRMD
jgi:hypothetical protein